jgi:predicted HicB family RNase H-like nuclease
MDHSRKKTSQMNVRIDPKLGAAIKALADDEGRSRANWCERALADAVERAKRKLDRRVARG